MFEFKTMPIAVPDVYKHQDSVAFFREFVEINRQKGVKFSTRYLAKQLAWPASYLTDLTAGRRPLTIARAIQFAKQAAMDEFATERLILIAIKDKDDRQSKGYADRALAPSYEDRLFLTQPVDPADFSEIEVLAILDLLVWIGSIPAVKVIKNLLPTFSSWSERRVCGIIKYLTEQKVFTVDGATGRLRSTHVYLQFDAFQDAENRRSRGAIHRQYAENFIRFCGNLSDPADLNSGFVMLSDDQFVQLRQKLLRLRNWMFKASDKNNGTGSSELGHLLYQYDMNLFPLVPRNCFEDWRNGHSSPRLGVEQIATESKKL